MPIMPVASTALDMAGSATTLSGFLLEDYIIWDYT